MNTTSFEKLKVTLKSKLSGLSMSDDKYLQCLKAFRLAEEAHCGFRKDNKTAEFYHQLSMLGLAMTYHSSLASPDLVYTVVLLHDTYEDYPEYTERLEKDFPAEMVYIKRISKLVHVEQPDGSFDTVKRNFDDYMNNMSICHVTSVVKGIDRVNNLSTMKGVFDLDKQLRYAGEAESHFQPMLKKARNQFPDQAEAYENIKSILNLLIENTRHLVANLRSTESN